MQFYKAKMKKAICWILAFVTIFGLSGCDHTQQGNETTATEYEIPDVTDEAEEKSEEKSEENLKQEIELGETVTAGNWNFTLMNVVFSYDIGNYGEYENYLIPGGKKSNENPLGLETGEIFAVVTYKLQNIGKEKLRAWDADDGTAIGTGKFLYGDGYYFESQSDGRRAQPDYYDGNGFDSMDGLYCEPLSEEIECRVGFVIPTEVAENTSESLAYEITFNETGDNIVLIYIIR